MEGPFPGFIVVLDYVCKCCPGERRVYMGGGKHPTDLSCTLLEGASSYEQGWNSQCSLSLNSSSSKKGPPFRRENHLGAGCGQVAGGTNRVDGVGDAKLSLALNKNVEAVTLPGAIQASLSVCRPGSASLGSCLAQG